MKTIRIDPPKYYETNCSKCGCTFTYTFEDIEPYKPELPEGIEESEYMRMLMSSFSSTYVVKCPICNESMHHAHRLSPFGWSAREFGGN